MKCVWNIDLSALMNKRITVETKEGHIISGKLTEVQWQPLLLNGEEISVPVEIGLDNSWSERVPFLQMVKLELEKA